ncbi:protein TIFY 10b-like [Asparagus officinalis]|uniref:protein TIFY 10b-like n=1 Tax=Asparagus officinalis TaxID=4686 RepID=UPI00098E4728|nr:protein TIFY 10b-like [Asparagus officinalis]
MSNAAAVTRGEKASSFAVTCNLLSQYLKENGRSLGDLGLAASIGNINTYRPPTTMSLLPGVDVSGDNTRKRVSDRNATKSMDLFPQRSGFSHQAPAAAAEDKKEPEKSQLTIFYGGKACPPRPQAIVSGNQFFFDALLLNYAIDLFGCINSY